MRAAESAKPRRPDTFITALSDAVESAIRAAAEGRAAVEAAIRAADEARASAAKELEQKEIAPGDVRIDHVYHVARSDLPPPPRFNPPKMGLLAQTFIRARGILGLEILIGGKD